MIPMARCQSHMESLIKSNPIKIIIQTRKLIWLRTAEALQKSFFLTLSFHPQSLVRVAVRMASTLRESASVTACANTTRAAALILRPCVA